MTIVQHAGSHRVRRITESATLEVRSRLGTPLLRLANAVLPEGERINLHEEFSAGYRMGLREGGREAVAS